MSGVDRFIDRLAEFLRSLRGDEDGAARGGTEGSGPAGSRDPDLQDAWKELDDFLRADAGRAERGNERRSTRPARAPDESLRQDYANLEVPFGADMETVRKSYKRLVLAYHPDRHSGNTEQQRIALEITKKINSSFERLRGRQEHDARSS